MSDLNEWNARIVEEFRGNGGWVRWSTPEDLAAGRPIPPPLPGLGDRPPIILVHNIGARSGRRRINPIMFQPVGDQFAVFATYGGSPRHPAWFHNLVATPRVTVEAADETLEVTARITDGEERARIWARQVEAMPRFADFEAQAGRQIPVVILEREREHGHNR